MYTAEVYKTDRRTLKGERLVSKIDHSSAHLQAIQEYYQSEYPASRGYRVVISQTYITRKSMMTGETFQERYDTPYHCSPSSESYWSN